MVKKSAKLIGLLLMLVLSITSFGFQKLTTTEMRKNSIRINALEIENVDVTIPKIALLLDEETLNFGFDKWNIRDEYIPLIEELRDFIIKNNFALKIYGYTDSIGTKEYNLSLSLKRANSFKDKLIELGLPAEQVVEVKGFGDADPVATNKTPKGRAANRRVELHLEKIESK